MTNITSRKHLFTVALCGLAGFTSTAAVTYENDFSKRTSGPVQTGRWMERRYANGQFAVNYPENATPTREAPYNAESEVQDNWAKVYLNGKVVNMIPSVVDDSANEATRRSSPATPRTSITSTSRSSSKEWSRARTSSTSSRAAS